jgi:hypothetical protein
LDLKFSTQKLTKFFINLGSKKRDRETAVSDSAEPGDFSNFPDIDPKTVAVLKPQGIAGLFPI